MGAQASAARQKYAAATAIDNLNKAYVKLAPSSHEGVGVFAMRDIPEGVAVLRWDWNRCPCVFIPEDELRERIPKEVFDQLRRIWHVDQNGLVATPVDFSATLSYINFLNHSQEPNLSYTHLNGAYVTTKPISKGEELFISYDSDYYQGYADGFRARESEDQKESPAKGEDSSPAG